MIERQNPARLDRKISYQTNTATNTGGEQVDSWSASTELYAGVLKASGNESFEQDQEVGKEKRAYLIRNEGTVHNPAITRLKEPTDVYWFYVTDVHYFKGSRNYLVLEAESKDNQPIESTTTADAVIASFPQELTPSEMNNITTIVNAMVASGNWDKHDALTCFALSNRDNSLWDWKRGVSNTEYNNPTHTAKKGFLFDGVNQYIDTNFTPSTDGVNYTQNAAQYGAHCYENFSTDTQNHLLGSFGASSNRSSILQNNNIISRINSITAISYGGQTVFQNQTRYEAVREDSASMKLLIDGVEVATSSQPSTPPPEHSILIAAYNNNGTPAGYLNARESFYYAGGGYDLAELKTELDLLKSLFIV